MSVKAVKVLRHFKNEDNIAGSRVFLVRKTKVLAALYWLQEHHLDYKKDLVNIKPQNLSWMEGKEEAQLDVNITLDDDEKQFEVCKDGEREVRSPWTAHR